MGSTPVDWIFVWKMTGTRIQPSMSVKSIQQRKASGASILRTCLACSKTTRREMCHSVYAFLSPYPSYQLTVQVEWRSMGNLKPLLLSPTTLSNRCYQDWSGVLEAVVTGAGLGPCLHYSPCFPSHSVNQVSHWGPRCICYLEDLLM